MSRRNGTGTIVEQIIAARLPYVDHVLPYQQCEGIPNRTPLKARFTMFGRPPVGMEHYRCRNPGQFRFRALKKSYGRDGVYCYLHLGAQLYIDPFEEARLERHLKRRGLWRGTGA